MYDYWYAVNKHIKYKIVKLTAQFKKDKTTIFTLIISIYTFDKLILDLKYNAKLPFKKNSSSASRLRMDHYYKSGSL